MCRNREFCVVFEATLEDEGIDTVAALRATLRFAQGRFGLLAVDVREIPPADTPQFDEAIRQIAEKWTAT